MSNQSNTERDNPRHNGDWAKPHEDAANDVVSWLDPDIRGNDALEQFPPANYGQRLIGWLVSDRAKRVANDGAMLIEPIDEFSAPEGSLFQ